MDGPAQGGGGTGLCYVGWILIPDPGLVSLTWASQSWISNLAGAAHGVAGAFLGERDIGPLTPSCTTTAF